MKKGEADRALAERELEEKNFEPIKPFVANIKRYKDEFQEVPQNYIFDFVMEFIKNDFPEKSQNLRIEELKEKIRKKKELQDELNKIREEKLTTNKDPKALPPKPESYFIGELNKLTKESNKGFILMDYPYNLSQAKFFEVRINNYVSENEKPKTIIETIKQNFNLILDSISKPNAQLNLVQGVFDFNFYMDVSNEESIKRAKNRKIDPVTGIVYHMEENQNPVEDKKVLERLLPYEPNLDLNEFSHKNIIHENEIKEMENFYRSFGHHKINLNSFKKITSMSNLQEKNNNSKENIIKNFNEISNLLNQKIKFNEEKDEEFLQHLNSQKEIISKDKESIRESFNNTINSQNYDGKSNTNKNQDGTGSIAAGEKLISRKTSVKSKIGNEFGKTNDKVASKSNLAEIQGSRVNTENDNMEGDKSTNNIGMKTGNDKNIQNLDEEDFNKYHKKLEETKKKIAPYMIENIFGIWNRSYENYVNGSKLFFLNLRKQKESIILRYNQIQENFIEFLRRPSKKSIDINNFHRKYNSFFDEFPQLIGDNTVKEEFQKDVKDLSDNIWEIIEIRKSEVIEERKRIMEVGFIKKEIDKFYLNVEKLFILEVEKLYANINILREYYFAMDLKHNSIDSMKFNIIDILRNKELNSLPIIIEDSKYGNFDNENESQKYPRLEKLYKNCFKLLIKFDEILKNIDKISKSIAINNNSSESSLKKISKAHFKRHHESTFVDEKREIFIYDEEMKNSIKAEKNKFKFRVTFIKFWAIQYFNNIRKISKMVYNKLDDWIISTIKAENDAMNNIINVFNNCIEKGMKIRNDFEMDSFDFYKTKDINEFIDITVKYKI
jgi:adenylate kinase family enzyme